MFKLKNLKFGTKILLLGISSVLITALVLAAVVVWQSSQFNALAQNEFSQLADSDLGHITEGVYNMVTAQDELVQQLVNYSLNVARQALHNTGQVSLATDNVEWTAVNQFTQQPVTIQLPKMLIGGNWLGQSTDLSIETPVVDEVQRLVGGTATIFQRMNEQGDMLRVATNVQTTDGQRAIGTYIPAIMPDGTPNPVVSTVLSGKTYRGDAFVVNAWYDTAYEPILNEAGQVMGMLYVGVKQQNVDSLRQAILRTKVGKTGYVYVLGSEGNDRGRYIISQQGQRDGENIWETQDAEGNYVIQSIINKALALKPGETAIERYLWQDPDDPAPRWKIAHLAYYAPWHWVIGASINEDELETYRSILQEGQSRMIVVSGAAGLAIALVAGLLSVLLARSISRPVGHLANVATQIAAGNLDVSAKVEQQDEIGTLATTFNAMTAQLRKLIGTLEQRVAQLRASAEVGRTVAAILDQDQLLRETVTLIAERFGFYYVAVFTLDNTGQSAVLREATGEAGRLLKERGYRLDVGGQSMVGTAIEQREPRMAQEARAEAARFANPLLPDTRSEIALPLIAGNRVLGALDVQSTQEAAFDEASAAVLQSMANQIGVALNNAEQFKQTEQQAALEAQLVQLSRSLFSATRTDDLYRTLATQIGDIVPHDYLSLALAQTNATSLREYELHATTDPVATDGAVRSRDNTLSGRAYGTHQVAISANTLADAPTLEDMADLERAGLRSAMSLPLLLGDRVLGTLNFASRNLSAFSTKDVALLEQVAGQIAAALENVRLAQAQQRILQELETLNRQLTGQAWSKEFQRLPGQVECVQYIRSGIEVELPTVLPEVELAVETQQPVAWTQTDEQRGPSPYQAALATPIVLRGEVLGALQVGEASQLRTWSDDDIAFIQAIADQVALALDNARLIEQTERRAQREQLISEISRKMLAANDMRGIIQAAGDELGRALQVGHTAVKLGVETVGQTSTIDAPNGRDADQEAAA